MSRIQKIVHTLLFPPRIAAAILGAVFLIFVAFVFLFDLSGTPIAYVAYLLSAYGLYLIVSITIVPLLVKSKARMRKNPYIDRYYTDNEFQSRVILYKGAALNLCYALFKFVSGIVLHSFWWIAIAVYYLVLCGMKAYLVRTDMVRGGVVSVNDLLMEQEWWTYRVTARLMFLLDLALSGIIVQVVLNGSSYSYPGTIIFVVAFYAFYRIAVAVIRILKGRKNRGALFSAAVAVDFSYAVVAMFTLQTAMLSTFGNTDSHFVVLFNIIGGSATVIIVLGIAVFMIIRSHKHIRKKINILL